MDSLHQLKTNIIECAKFIRSNDATFGISTLPKEKMRALMRTYVDLVRKTESCDQAFHKLNTELENSAADLGVDQELDNEYGEERLQSELEEKYYDLYLYQDLFRTTAEEFRQGLADSETDALTEIERVVSDEEIQVEQETARQIPKDPITKKAIKIAVRSTVCNHIYDKVAIEDYFDQKERAHKSRIQCPQAGCTNKNMRRNELVLDEETNDLIQSCLYD